MFKYVKLPPIDPPPEMFASQEIFIPSTQLIKNVSFLAFHSIPPRKCVFFIGDNSVCIFGHLLISANIDHSSAYSAKHLRHVLTGGSWTRHGSAAQTAVARLPARTADKYWVTIATKSPRRQNLYFSPTPEENFVCQQRRFGIYQFRIFYFPSCVFSPIHWGAGGGCFIPPNQPKCNPPLPRPIIHFI